MHGGGALQEGNSKEDQSEHTIINSAEDSSSDFSPSAVRDDSDANLTIERELKTLNDKSSNQKQEKTLSPAPSSSIENTTGAQMNVTPTSIQNSRQLKI